jgi:MoxR-like ATPase
LNGREEVDLMDCFLIKDCIWDGDSRRYAVFQYVSGAIEEYGYTVSVDFAGLGQELKEFKTEIDEETKFVKDTRKKVLEIVHDGYYEIIGMPTDRNLIKKSDFDGLTNTDQSKRLYYRSNYGINSNYSFNLRKGNTKFSVFIDDTEFQLKTVVHEEKRQKTKKPHPAVEKDWDERITQYLQQTEEWKERIESYRNKDLEHLRANVFVSPEWANIVESHITKTTKDIEKIRLDIRAIQSAYKRLKDEEVVIND